MRRVALLAAAMLLASATVVQGGTVSKVSGTYTYTYGFGYSTVVLDARATTPASGTFSFARDNGDYMAGNVTCVTIKGQDAWIVGVVTDTNTDATYWAARVYDSGLRGGTGDAAVSFAGVQDASTCTGPYQWNLTSKWMAPITSGNILIH